MRLGFAVLCLATACAAAAATPSRTFEPMDVFALEWASDPAVSPDGDWLVYVRNGFDRLEDRRTHRLWRIDVSGEAHAPLTTLDVNATSPVFSPDGARVAFVAETDNGSELYMHWVEDGRTARITQLPESPANLAFSPDGRWLAFTMFVEQDEPPLGELPEAPDEASWAPPPKVVDEVIYRVDGAGYLEDGFSHVFVVPADGGSGRQVTRGDFNHDSRLAWSPDGETLYVAANRSDDWAYEPLESEIFAIDVASGAAQAITARDGPDTTPALSPNGRWLAYLGFDDERQGYQFTRLYLLDLDSGETRVLGEDLDRSIAAPRWDGDRLYVAFDDAGTTKVARAYSSGRIEVLAGEVGGVSLSRPYTGGDYDVAGGTLVVTHSDPRRPADLAVVARGEPRVLTRLNADALGHKHLAEISEIRFPSSVDGREIHGWLVSPPDAGDGPLPLILEIHGGPFAAYGPHFSAEVQLYAAAGYRVLYLNPRGSTSYGEEFANLIHHAYPGEDYDDLMSGVDAVIARGLADPEQLFVTGGSGGGVLTAWIVTQTDRFRAAASAKPVINWLSFVLTADMTNFFYRYWFESPPWTSAEAYLERSPLTYVGDVSTPTLLITGVEDFRTPIGEAEQFYQALKLRRVDTMLVRMPGASHHIADRPSQLIGKVASVLGWFARYRDDGDA